MSLSTVHENLISVAPIPQDANYCFTSVMDIQAIRRQNLIVLMGDQSKVAYADFVGTDASYLSQILSPKLRGRVGEDLARRIEAKHGLRRGWMDIEHRHELSAQARSVAEAVDSQGYSHDLLEQLANYLLNQIIQFRSIRADSSPKEMGTNTGNFPALQAPKNPPK